MSRLFVSDGNEKMGKIPSVSLPPLITCREDPPCKKDCYACRMCRIRRTVRAANQRNLDFYREDPDAFFNELSAYFYLNKFFRMNVSGDIPDPDYFRRLVIAARKNKGCQILIFTKKFEIVNEYVENGGKTPSNLHIVFSNWGDFKCPNPYNFPVAEVLFGGEIVPPDWKICGGNCSDCICRNTGCWKIKKGETIAFYKH